MTILTTLETIDLDEEQLDSPYVKELAAAYLNELFERQHDHELHCTTTSVTFGKNDPEKIVDAARKWNKNVLKYLMDAIYDLLPEGIDYTEPLRIELDTLKTYQFKKAAQMVDNEYTPYGPFAIFWPGEFSFSPVGTKTVMTDGMLAQIKQQPEEYVLFTVNITNTPRTRPTMPAYDWDDN